MQQEKITGEYLVCTAAKQDIRELVRMRLLLQEHMEQVNALILRYNSDWKNELPLFYNKLLDDLNVLILKAITEKDHEIVGMMVGVIVEHPNFTIERSVKIDDVWVDTEHRKKGVCSLLLTDLRNRFAEKGIKNFTLNYVVNNREAEQTWRALGFVPTITNCVAKP